MIPCVICISWSGVSDSLQTHGLQPASFFCPWNPPGKYIEVGNHSLLQGIFPTQGLNLGLPHCRQILYCLSHQGSSPKKVLIIQLFPTLCNPMDCSLCPWNSPGQNTGVGSLSLLWGIFPTQGLNLGLPHYRQILYHKGSPRILEWVVMPSSRGSSQPRD